MVLLCLKSENWFLDVERLFFFGDMGKAVV